MNFRSYVWFVRGAEHAAMCATSIESVLKADKHAKVYVFTDEQHPSWTVPAALMRIDPGMPIMLANLEAQVCARAAFHETLYFLDTDTILLRPFDIPVCDIAFTWRDHIGTDEEGEKVEGIADRMPYNYGVVVADDTIGAMESLIWMRERIRSMHNGYQQWYGNQMAAFELAGRRPDSGTVVDRKRIPWKLTNLGRELAIAKLPCETHNYTPQSAGEDVSGKFVLHFKGKKRWLMSKYAKALGLKWHLPEISEPVKTPDLADLAMVSSL